MRLGPAVTLILLPSILAAQTAITTRNTNLRPDASTSHTPLRLFGPGDSVTLLETVKQNGFYHVKTPDNVSAWLWSANVRVLNAPHGLVPTTSAGYLEVAGSNAFAGCGDGLWKHVYNPSRLLVHVKCVTMTGVLVDPTAHNAHPSADGVRHEQDGDTHGWLKVDSKFASMINAGNTSNEGGNLVFEIVCHYTVSQDDAKPACTNFHDGATLPAHGSHVEIKGTFVQDDNHAHWNEIHPVSSIRVVP